MNSCHLFAGHLDHWGYGEVTEGNKHYKVHRVVYEHEVGEIPQGLVLNHLCRNRSCCNTNHLEVTTHRHNILTGVGMSAVNAKKTHCNYGHEFNKTNTHMYRNKWRICKACYKRKNAKRLANK